MRTLMGRRIDQLASPLCEINAACLGFFGRFSCNRACLAEPGFWISARNFNGLAIPQTDMAFGDDFATRFQSSDDLNTVTSLQDRS